MPQQIYFTILLLALTGSACGPKPQSSKGQTCQAIWGLDSVINHGKVLLLGELHGTQEAPHYVAQTACLALKYGVSVTVGLELPYSEEETIEAFMNGEVEQATILGLPFWAKEYQDGRTSQAMFTLLATLRQYRAEGGDIQVVLIDDPKAEDRDFAMAQRVIAEASKKPHRYYIVLTGNHHTLIEEGTGHMGSYIVEYLGRERVTALNQAYRGGSAWLDIAGTTPGPVSLGGVGRAGVGVLLGEHAPGYHGTFEMDSIHYSPPAKHWLN